jgi:hypothetical protein
MENEKLLKIINIIRSLREEGSPTMNLGSGKIAGTVQAGDDPPVDLRRRKYKRLPLLYKDLFRRKKNV